MMHSIHDTQRHALLSTSWRRKLVVFILAHLILSPVSPLRNLKHVAALCCNEASMYCLLYRCSAFRQWRIRRRGYDMEPRAPPAGRDHAAHREVPDE